MTEETSGWRDKRRWILLATVVTIGVAIDQISKYFAHRYLASRDLVVVIDGIFELRYARNPGAFFSLGADLSPDFRRVLFVGASIIATGLIVRLYAQTQKNQGILRWALVFLLAGAIGNLVDRAMSGEVIDFAHLYWRGHLDWATFNVADTWIVVGLVLLGLDLVIPAKRTAAAPEVARDTQRDDPPIEKRTLTP
jgi:signal peptidase II